jgi:hypothetical protein
VAERGGRKGGEVEEREGRRRRRRKEEEGGGRRKEEEGGGRGKEGVHALSSAVGSKIKLSMSIPSVDRYFEES